MVEVTPVTQTVLDVSPYNVILIVCNATQPQVVNVSKRISWEQISPSGTMLILDHNGINTNVSEVGLDYSTSTSTLSLYAISTGTWSYKCISSIQIPGDPVIAYSQIAEVVVKGMLMKCKLASMYEIMFSSTFRSICS